ncbi:MAG: hypothetical protein JOZ51_28900 [Chloroflexi bacterium]|nr:hypothetical protein [Chloroflexota bacterium]
MSELQPLINGDALEFDLAFGISDTFFIQRFSPFKEEPLQQPNMPILEHGALSAVAVAYIDELAAYYARVLDRIALHRKQLDLNRMYFAIGLCFYQSEEVVEVFQFDDNIELRQFVTMLATIAANHEEQFMLDPYLQLTVRTTETDLFMEETSLASGQDFERYRFTKQLFQERLHQAIARVEMIEHAIEVKLQGAYFGFSSAL